jgi:FMN phosphatase YigB (HAD superfamily)
MLPLAFSVHSGPGVYALLLGSGLSRAAGIPTGWEVTLDLLSKLAAMVGKSEEAETDPVAWYRQRYGEEPDYSKVVNHLSVTPADRRQLLEGYFEPTEEEREEGKKLPTQGHRSVAELAAKGYVRVILTTNFDKLMERALESTGVTPTVISTPDAAKGAPPLQHTRCTVIKVNGDYLDDRIKNTPKELAEYDPSIQDILDKVFDEYGLIICGWSGEYDTALIDAFKRARNRRFTTYWASRGEPTRTIEELVEFADGRVIVMTSADEFFQELLEKVTALEDYGGNDPLSAPLAIATTKKYVAEEQHRVRLRDFVMGEARRLHDILSSEDFPPDSGSSSEGLLKRVRRYEALSEVLLGIVATGCYWGIRDQEELWTGVIELVANPELRGREETWINLRRYPALLLAYAGGVAAVASSRYGNLRALLRQPLVEEISGEKPFVLSLHPGSLLSQSTIQQLPGMERHLTPMSDWLHATLRDPLKEYIALPRERVYDVYFDKFECFLALVYLDLTLQRDPNRDPEGATWAPVGRFLWQGRYSTEENVLNELHSEFEQRLGDWPPFTSGLLECSVEEYRVLEQNLSRFVEKHRPVL